MSGQPRILLMVADSMLRQTMAEHLEGAASMVVVQSATAEVGCVLAAGHDLIVVDEALNDPEDSGLCQRLRDLGIAAPLLLLGVQAVSPPGCPCDGVLTKPLRLSALVAKITETLARRPDPAALRIGPWRLEAGRKLLVSDDDRKIRLTHKEVAILLRLAQAAGQVVSREAMLADIWGYSAQMDTHTLETHIYRLRRKIEPKGDGTLLLNEGGGYRLSL